MAKAKAKAAPKKEVAEPADETITREEVKETKAEPEKAPPTPKASNVEKTESFTAAFKNDAHSKRIARMFLKKFCRTKH